MILNLWQYSKDLLDEAVTEFENKVASAMSKGHNLTRIAKEAASLIRRSPLQGPSSSDRLDPTRLDSQKAEKLLLQLWSTSQGSASSSETTIELLPKLTIIASDDPNEAMNALAAIVPNGTYHMRTLLRRGTAMLRFKTRMHRALTDYARILSSHVHIAKVENVGAILTLRGIFGTHKQNSVLGYPVPRTGLLAAGALSPTFVPSEGYLSTAAMYAQSMRLYGYNMVQDCVFSLSFLPLYQDIFSLRMFAGEYPFSMTLCSAKPEALASMMGLERNRLIPRLLRMLLASGAGPAMLVDCVLRRPTAEQLLQAKRRLSSPPPSESLPDPSVKEAWLDLLKTFRVAIKDTVQLWSDTVSRTLRLGRLVCVRFLLAFWNWLNDYLESGDAPYLVSELLFALNLDKPPRGMIRVP